MATRSEVSHVLGTIAFPTGGTLNVSLPQRRGVVGVVAIQITGTMGGGATITFQGTMDGTNWVSILATPSDSTTRTTTTTANGIFYIDVSCLYAARLSGAASGTGTATISDTPSQG